MPVVPMRRDGQLTDPAQTPQGPAMPDEHYLMMAATQMHAEGRLFEPVAEQGQGPTSIPPNSDRGQDAIGGLIKKDQANAITEDITTRNKGAADYRSVTAFADSMVKRAADHYNTTKAAYKDYMKTDFDRISKVDPDTAISHQRRMKELMDAAYSNMMASGIKYSARKAFDEGKEGQPESDTREIAKWEDDEPTSPGVQATGVGTFIRRLQSRVTGGRGS